jgi:hypothetical protein
MRVVQYMAYCICGQQAGQLLAKVKGCRFAELLCRYDDCIRIARWADHNPFLDSSLVKMLICVLTHAVGHPVKEVAETLLRDLRVLQTGMCEERIRYPLLRMTRTIVISDVVAGFAITQYDWCGMAAFLRSYAQYSEILELNTERNLSFNKAAVGLGAVFLNPTPGMTFHIFWSPRDPSGRLRSDLGDQIADLSGMVRSITQQKHVPYLCLDMTAMEELEANDPNLSFAELITSLQEKGAIVEQLDTLGRKIPAFSTMGRKARDGDRADERVVRKFGCFYVVGRDSAEVF